MAGDRLGRRVICVVTTSRADYGYLRGVMREVDDDPDLDLQVVVGGSHLSADAGNSVREVEADGFPIHARLAFTPASDSGADAARALGAATVCFTDALSRLRPDIVVVLGDRYEILAPAAVCLLLRIPLAHLHGGECSVGAVDESVRHAVSKLAALHFPAAEVYRRRIIRMGEDPTRVFNCGSPGLDGIRQEKRLSRAELASRLGMSLDQPTALVAFHPATLNEREARAQVSGMLDAIDRSALHGVVTGPNADPGGRAVNEALEAFCAARSDRFRLFHHLGATVFHSALEHLDVLVGNSSSGIIEAPSFRTPVVNVGDRQEGRLRAANVIDCGYGADEILDAIQRALSPAFRQSLASLVNPYDEHGDGRASWRIKEQMKAVALGSTVLKKAFWEPPEPENA
jgi:UDP-N-acetylglucosamine 2-epimerase (non-hydrolysing)/GDP/UDP-N,N'-diacetylbacillosamine 2-epimerase (hydrolysing)